MRRRPRYAALRPAQVRAALGAPAPHDGWVSRWTDVRGLATHHRQPVTVPAGGVPVVLVHGLAVSHRYLMPTARALADHGLPALVPDLPGFGLSGKPGAAYDVHAHADHLAAWLSNLGLPPVALVGHSFGAEVAAALAADRPAAVAALVLAGPTADRRARSRWGQVRRFVADLLLEDPRQARILARDVRDAGVRRIAATVGHSIRNAIERDVTRLRVPLLVLGGERDAVSPARWRSELAASPGVTVPGAAHNVLTTAGTTAAAAIAAFVDDVRKESTRAHR